ncbi:MAG: NUDIX domain-containing protein [Rhodospirillales bacterium]|nr:NUDIX domain-containing protein [Rhodospirillales bacterium]
MNKDDIEIIEKTTPFQGYFRLDHYRLRHKLFEGGWSGEMSREVFERGHAVAALLYDPHLDKLVMIEQFRIGALAALESRWFDDGFSPWLIETMAGIIEDGEDPEDVVRREAVEETGCSVSKLEMIHHYLATPGGSSESVYLYCGQVDAANANGIHGITDEHENIKVLTVDPEEAFSWLDTGKIRNSMTLIALYWFRFNRQRLRRDWRA